MPSQKGTKAAAMSAKEFITSKLRLHLRQVLIAMGMVLGGLTVVAVTPRSVSAACPAPEDDYGSVTMTVNVTSPDTYRVWSRIMAPDSASNSYLLEVDGGTCLTIGDSSIPANTWTWVDYQNGNTSSKADITLSAGSHTLKAIGREPDVKLDRILLLSDESCVPAGTGDNCAADTSPPTAGITAPTNGATVSGNIMITAIAEDDIAMDRVEFYRDSTKLGEDDTFPYSYNWNTSTVADGTYTLTARAVDTSDNETDSAGVIVEVDNTSLPDLVIESVEPLSATNGSQVIFSATVRNNGEGATTLGVNHGLRFLINDQVVTWSGSNTGVTIGPDQQHTFVANNGVGGLAYWLAEPGTHTLRAEVDDLGLIAESDNSNNWYEADITVGQPPGDTTKPTVSITSPSAGAIVSGTAVVTVNANDNVGVTEVRFYVDGNQNGSADFSPPYSFNWDTTEVANGSHILTARAYDAAGNEQLSAGVSVSVANSPPKTGDINGDGKVDVFDLSILATNFGLGGRLLAHGDLNGDSVVNVFDLSILATNWGN